MNKLVVGGIIVIALLAISAGSLTGLFTASSGEKVKVAHIAIVQSGPLYYAVEKGYFKQEGIDLELVKFDAPKQIVDAVVLNQVDFGGPGSATGISAIAESLKPGNLKYYTLSCLTPETGNNLIVKKDSSINLLKELEGKKIAHLPGPQWRTIVNRILKRNNIDTSKTELVDLAVSLQLQALASGNVDAVVALDPVATIGIEKGIARELGIPRKTVQAWLKRGGPRAVRNAATVAPLFPLTLHRLQTDLRPLARLMNYALLSGHTSTSSYTTHFNIRNETEEHFVTKEIEQLKTLLPDLRYAVVNTKKEGKVVSRSFELRGKSGRALVRLFHEAGIQFGHKVNLTTLPFHLTFASDTAEMHGVEHVKTILEDFLEILQLTRKVHEHRDTVLVTLPQVRKREDAERIALQVEQIARHLQRHTRRSTPAIQFRGKSFKATIRLKK